MKKTEATNKKIGIPRFDPASIELKWQSKWELDGVYQPGLDSAKRPFYNLMMFPYPSAEGLHVGSVYAFGGADIYSRFKRMQGYDVFEPIGLDGFGIHSENHAIKMGDHPIDHAERTEKNFYRQLRSIGNGFAWKNKLETYDPDYYKWTQWLFTELFKAGLAYKKESPVNFCPSCKTVLADEQVIDGKCERCGSVVEKRKLNQWFFKITNYADRLLANIESLDWSEKVKIAQKNWIGKSEGVYLEFPIKEMDEKIKVFTTAIDTVYGVTFLVLAPEHPLVQEILKRAQHDKRQEIQNYIKSAISKSEQDRLAEGKEKSGVFSSAYVVNPFNGEQIPIWIADYVLAGYGTGAVMGVPGHDSRDHEFAKKYKLQIRPVMKPKTNTTDSSVGEDGFWDYKEIKSTFKENSVVFNSGDLDGLTSKEAKKKLEEQLEHKGIGQRVSTYHLRDWLISRQRYWGPPIPMIFCESCKKRNLSWFDTEESEKRYKIKEKNPTSYLLNLKSDTAGWYPVPLTDLPVALPHIKDFKPVGTGKAPLANYPEFYETTCPHCGGKAVRETDVSDTFLDSAWYFLRYLATDWRDIPFPMRGQELKNMGVVGQSEAEVEKRSRFLPVTMYIGGAEHSVLHLLYARFVTMVLHDLGYLSFEEPFTRFYAHGLIIKDGAKMSKSKGNVINPDDYIKKYGADAVRCYLLFLGPFNQGGDFRDTGMEGMAKFIKRVWALFMGQSISSIALSVPAKSILNETIMGVTEDMENLRYNTAIAKLMSYYNYLSKQESLHKEEIDAYLKLLAPFAPHITEELWAHFGNEGSIHTQPYPTYNSSAIVKDVLTIPVQINGKLRGTLSVKKAEAENHTLIEKMAKEDESVAKFLKGKTIKKLIYVPGKVVNLVI